MGLLPGAGLGYRRAALAHPIIMFEDAAEKLHQVGALSLQQLQGQPAFTGDTEKTQHLPDGATIPS